MKNTKFKKFRNAGILLLLSFGLLGCGEKIGKEDQAKYDALLKERDSLDDIKVALAISLILLENTHMCEDTSNINDAIRKCEEFKAVDSANNAQIEAYLKRFPKLKKPEIPQTIIEIVR